MSLLLALAIVTPACVLDTKLVDNLDVTITTADGAATETDTTPLVTDGDETAAPTTANTDVGDDACRPPDTVFEWVLVTNADDTWLQPIDEPCTVTSSQIVPFGFELRLDCPVHAALHGELELAILSDQLPNPDILPGDVLDVYYQPHVSGGPHPEMLFLRSAGELLYAAARGFFLDPNDAAVAAAHYAPLTVEVEPGPCPLSDNPYVEPPEGFVSDGFTCKHDALAEVHFGFGDGAPLVLGQFMSGELAAGPATYTASVLSARRGVECPDLDLEKFFLAIVRTSAP